jgi:serine/threonine protein kinase
MLPKGDEYVGALQHPNIAFRDNDLKTATIEKTRSGLPRPYSGGFNMVFHAQTPRGDWAIRCFTRDVPEVLQRYSAISNFLNTCPDAVFMRAQLIRDELLVRGQRHHIVKMEWDRGLQLDKYIERCIHDSPKRCKAQLQALADQIMMLGINLDRLGIAHGDLSHSNIRITSDAKIRLIDYDDMYLPQLAHLKMSSGLGHQNYQHPKRASNNYSETMDRFSLFVLYSSLIALAKDPTLWQRHDGGDDCILFRRADFADPQRSQLFQELARVPEVSKWAERLASVSRHAYSAIPSLYEFIDGSFAHSSGHASAMGVTRPAPTPPHQGFPNPQPKTNSAATNSAATSSLPQWRASRSSRMPQVYGTHQSGRSKPSALFIASIAVIVIGMGAGNLLQQRLHPTGAAVHKHSIAPDSAAHALVRKTVAKAPVVQSSALTLRPTISESTAQPNSESGPQSSATIAAEDVSYPASHSETPVVLSEPSGTLPTPNDLVTDNTLGKTTVAGVTVNNTTPPSPSSVVSSDTSTQSPTADPCQQTHASIALVRPPSWSGDGIDPGIKADANVYILPSGAVSAALAANGATVPMSALRIIDNGHFVVCHGNGDWITVRIADGNFSILLAPP